MGQQYNKVIKRKRRKLYLERKRQAVQAEVAKAQSGRKKGK